jgi:pimeloyl-ACP methyl ester carboxylesterase
LHPVLHPAFPDPIRATPADLPPAVALAAQAPPPPQRGTTDAAGIPWAWLAWGDPVGRPLLLLHGVTSSATGFWRLGPALAAAGWRAVAVDQAGHGLTGHWSGHHRFRDNAADIAAFARAAGLAGSEGDAGDPSTGLGVIGHSWGAMTAAALPAAGLRPARLVLLDPPAMPLATMTAMTEDPVERAYDDLDEAIRVIAAHNPTWDPGDVRAKAEGLFRMDVRAALAILTENGDWDAGLADLRDPAMAGVPVRIVRGDPAAGGLLPDAWLPALAEVVGAGSILTVAGGAHSPHRARLAATLVALLRALSD